MTGIEKLRRLGADAVRGGEVGRAICDIADQIEREAQPKCDHAADVSMSAYDLLPADEREAIAWVREHGGLDHVRAEWDRRSNLKRTCEKLRANVERQQRHIEFVQRKCRERQGHIVDLNKMVDEMRPRLMPDGMEWLVEAWPRFKDDSPVRLLDDFERYGEESGVSAVTMYVDGSFALNCRAYSKGERVNRPAPKGLDADGVEIRVGDTVCGTRDMEPMRVVDTDSRECGFKHIKCEKEGDGFFFYCADELTHKMPALADDGKPLREGETVWHVATGAEYTVRDVTSDGAHLSNGDRPGGYCRAKYLTHERPDTWERIEEDARSCTCVMEAIDLVRRARALAERDA